jgi:hypothetical protein
MSGLGHSTSFLWGEYGEKADFRQRFVVSGSAGTTISGLEANYGLNETFVTSPGQTAKYDFSENFSQQVLMLDPTAVERKLTASLEGKHRNATTPW